MDIAPKWIELVMITSMATNYISILNNFLYWNEIVSTDYIEIWNIIPAQVNTFIFKDEFRIELTINTNEIEMN